MIMITSVIPTVFEVLDCIYPLQVRRLRCLSSAMTNAPPIPW